jgi:CheY-like chemotaxis protein
VKFVGRINSISVLVVEDDFFIRMTIADQLRDHGLTVIEAKSGEEAVAVLSEHDPSPIRVLFTDIQLGGPLTGWDVAEVFRRTNSTGVVLYTSGLGRDGDRSVPRSVFFAKPYDHATVLRTINEAVNSNRPS